VQCSVLDRQATTLIRFDITAATVPDSAIWPLIDSDAPIRRTSMLVNLTGLVPNTTPPHHTVSAT